MDSVIEIRKNFLTAEEVELLISELPQFLRDAEQNVVKNSQSAFGLNGYKGDFNFKETDTLEKLTGNKKTDEAILLLTKVFFRMKKEMENFFGIKLVPIQCILNRILLGGHNWPPHIDDELGSYQGFEYAGLLYLGDHNKDFTGGEIIFPLEDLTVEPKKGLFVFFKADAKAPHGVKEVTSGYRDGIITFFGDYNKVKEKDNGKD